MTSVSYFQTEERKKCGPKVLERAARSNRMKRRWMREKLKIPTRKGLREITVSDSRQASQIGRYWNAVKLYLETGDASGLRQFEGQYVTDINDRRFPFLIDRQELDRLGNAGVLSFETIYAKL
jgi:hypothetical protein